MRHPQLHLTMVPPAGGSVGGSLLGGQEVAAAGPHLALWTPRSSLQCPVTADGPAPPSGCFPLSASCCPHISAVSQLAGQEQSFASSWQAVLGFPEIRTPPGSFSGCLSGCVPFPCPHPWPGLRSSEVSSPLSSLAHWSCHRWGGSHIPVGLSPGLFTWTLGLLLDLNISSYHMLCFVPVS